MSNYMHLNGSWSNESVKNITFLCELLYCNMTGGNTFPRTKLITTWNLNVVRSFYDIYCCIYSTNRTRNKKFFL